MDRMRKSNVKNIRIKKGNIQGMMNSGESFLKNIPAKQKFRTQQTKIVKNYRKLYQKLKDCKSIGFRYKTLQSISKRMGSKVYWSFQVLWFSLENYTIAKTTFWNDSTKFN